MRTLTVTLGLRWLVRSSLCLLSFLSAAQTVHDQPGSGPQPLYRVTIVSRTTKAINYGYLTAPTRIGFRGTPLLPGAQGEASIQPKRGSTIIDAKFSKMPPPTRFGPQYLTYVVWAISRDGRPQNLGEISLSPSDKGRLSASTSLQTFALIVTAEPYYSVSQPSDVVVMENVLRPETVGKVEEMNATYELLPRKEFTYDMSRPQSTPGKLVSRSEYEALLAIYQTQNAIQIAQSQGAEVYAPERLAQARQLLDRAKGLPKSLNSEIIATAKEATQVAEDSRVIAQKRAEAKRSAEQQSQQIEEQRTQAKLRATEAERDEAERAKSELGSIADRRDQAEQARRGQAPPQQIAAPPATPRQPIEVDERQFYRENPQASVNRQRLLTSLRGPLSVIDTPRGIVMTIPTARLSSPSVSEELRQLASAIRPYRDLHLEVEGHTASPDTQASDRYAELIRAKLVAASVPPEIIVVRGYGNSRPLTSNASASGRAQNNRVEVVITGDAIGSSPTWDRSYSLRP